MTFGERIKILRKSRKLTLDALAKMIGSNKGYIWELENKGIKNTSLGKASKIADALNVSIGYLVSGNKDQSLSDTEQKVIKKLRNLNDFDRGKFLGFLDGLNNEYHCLAEYHFDGSVSIVKDSVKLVRGSE